jgi:hypothetical protein
MWEVKPGQAVLIPAENLALYSVALACSAADRDLHELPPDISGAQRMAFLEEMIFFHHFIATSAVFHVIHDPNSRRNYCERMVPAIAPGSGLPSNEQLGLPPLAHFSVKDRDDAIKKCFLSFANINACMMQELYLARKPSESELEIMNLTVVRQMTRWDSPSVNATQYFAAALLARLAISQKIAPPERSLAFMKLSFLAVATSRAAFEIYIEALGAEVSTESDDTRPQKTPKSKGNWLSRLFNF